MYKVNRGVAPGKSGLPTFQSKPRLEIQLFLTAPNPI